MGKGKVLYVVLGLGALAAFYFLYWRKRHGGKLAHTKQAPAAAKHKRSWRSKLGGFAKNLSQPLVTGAVAGIPGGAAILGAASESGLL